MLSCFAGIFVQAIVTNLMAILFIPIMDLYGLTYVHLGILVGINFTTQVSADLIFSGAIDKVGFRRLVLPACALAFFGLLLFGLSPFLMPGHVFLGLVLSTIVFAFSSGLLEVLLSPIVSGIPHDDKGPAMSLMHSFYAWGQVATIILTTLTLFLAGSRAWPFIAIGWALVPLVTFGMFLGAKFPEIIPDEHRLVLKDILFRPFYLLALVAIFAGGASEVVMNQWSSTFMERALSLPKLAGDLVGMTGFAVMLGLGRVLHGLSGGKDDMHRLLVFGSLAAAVCYVVVALSPIPAVSVVACIACGLAVSLLWPGTIVVASERYPMAGAWMFAILAVAGDVGAAFGPYLTGQVIDVSMDSAPVRLLSGLLDIPTEQAAIRFGLLVAIVFPVLAFFVHRRLGRSGARAEPGAEKVRSAVALPVPEDSAGV
jgi:MFS family permease